RCCRVFLASVLLVAVSSRASILYVNVNSANSTPPYATWAAAATNIQDAIDASVAGDQIVVTNGVYARGGRAVYGTMTNRVAVDRPIGLRSVNGPQFTTIHGYQVPSTTNGDGAIRCVYLTNGASLSGFSLTGGATSPGDGLRDQSGGGLWCEPGGLASNCVISGNSAFNLGGGAYGGALTNCTLTGNSASFGGGAYGGTLNNCTLSG